MKNKILNFPDGLIVLILIQVFISCNSKEKHPTEIIKEPPGEVISLPEAGKIYDRVSKNNSSYSLYIPKDYKGKEKYPAIIFIDPHSKGSFPLNKYKDLAEKFQFMLIGCNDSKNGMAIEQSMKFINDLLNEAATNLPGRKDEISLAGFSGGAKVAIFGGNSMEGFSNVTYCGAALPTGSIKISIPMLAIAGSHDMNYTEVKNFDQSLSQQEISHAFIEWNGKHEWPDSSTFVHAFYWNLFSSMRKNNTEKNITIINDYKQLMDAELLAEKNPVKKALLLSEEIIMLKDLTPVGTYSVKLKSLTDSRLYKDAKRKEDMILAYEDQRKTEFAGAFENRELSWFQDQIQLLNRDTTNESNQRLLGYISLAAWSYSSKAVEVNNPGFAVKALQIYKLADPKNSEQPFLAAKLYAKNNQPDSAIYFLNESILLGLDDRNKIENDQDFSVLKSRSDYQEIIAKIR